MGTKYFLVTTILSIVAGTGFAEASVTRTYLSRNGSDSGTCAITAPCRTLPYALLQTAPNGEIIILDTGGFGNATITQAVSIINDSNTAIINAGSGNGITINAGANDSVVLRGLTVDGLGTGTNGIVFNSGGSLTIENCRVLNFAGSTAAAGNGILLQPSGAPKIAISQTNSSSNGNIGIYLLGTSSAVVQMNNNVTNKNLGGVSLSGGASAVFNVTNGIASQNSNFGFGMGGSTTIVLDSLVATGNGAGLVLDSDSVTYISRSILSGNGAGVYVNGKAFGYTLKNNVIKGNSSNTNPPNALITATPD